MQPLASSPLLLTLAPILAGAEKDWVFLQGSLEAWDFLGPEEEGLV